MGGSTVKRPFNLQLFADPGETGANDVSDVGSGAADPAQDTGTAGSNDPAKEKDPAKAFAARLGHERKKIESEYAPYKGVIERQAKAAGMEPGEYLEYLQKQQEQEDLEAEAERTGKDPEVIRIEREAKEAKERLAEVERKERLTAEEKDLVSDPKIGKFVADNLEKIREIAEATGTDMRTGLALVATEKLPELLELTNPETHIKNYLESLKKGGKPIEIGGGATAPSATPPKTFEEARKAAIEKLRT